MELVITRSILDSERQQGLRRVQRCGYIEPLAVISGVVEVVDQRISLFHTAFLPLELPVDVAALLLVLFVFPYLAIFLSTGTTW